MERLTYIIFLFLVLVSCTDSGQKGARIENNLIDVADVSGKLVDSLSRNGIGEIILYRIDCKNCEIKLPAYIIWQSDGHEFIEKVKTNGQRVRLRVKPSILNYVRRMEDGLLREELIDVTDSTIMNVDDVRKEILKIVLDGKVIQFPSCEYCAGDRNKFHHALRDYVTNRLFRDEIGGLLK